MRPDAAGRVHVAGIVGPVAGVLRMNGEQVVQRRQVREAVNQQRHRHHKARQRPGQPDIEKLAPRKNPLPNPDNGPKRAQPQRKRHVVGQRSAHPVVARREVVPELVHREHPQKRQRVPQPAPQLGPQGRPRAGANTSIGRKSNRAPRELNARQRGGNQRDQKQPDVQRRRAPRRGRRPLEAPEQRAPHPRRFGRRPSRAGGPAASAGKPT